MPVREKLTQQKKQWSERGTETEDEVAKGKGTVADSNFKLKAADKCAKDVAYEQDILQARLEQSQHGQGKLGESITHVQEKGNLFSAGLKEDQEYMERRTDIEGCKLQNDLGLWFAKRVVEEKQTQYVASKVTIKHNTFN